MNNLGNIELYNYVIFYAVINHTLKIALTWFGRAHLWYFKTAMWQMLIHYFLTGWFQALPYLIKRYVNGPYSQTLTCQQNTSSGHKGDKSGRFSWVLFHIHGAEALSNYHQAHKTTLGNAHNLYKKPDHTWACLRIWDDIWQLLHWFPPTFNNTQPYFELFAPYTTTKRGNPYVRCTR